MNWNTAVTYMTNWNNLLDLMSHMESVLLRMACLILLAIALARIVRESMK